MATALANAPRPAICVVACSGGPDSAALLGLVERLARRLQLRLAIAHVAHGRRAAAVAEAALVSGWARARGHEAHCLRLAIADGPSWPARARAARRAALQGLAVELGAHAILLGHTATDQAETVLLHLCRGAGLRGLAAMPSIDAPNPTAAAKQASCGQRPQERAWVRPLLGLTRAETRALAVRMAIPFVDDPSNETLSHPRTHLRHRVLPALEAINPGAVLHIAHTAELLQHAQLSALAASEPTTAARLDARELRAADVGTRREAIRGLCLRAGIAADELGARTVTVVELALRRGLGRRRWDLHGRRTLRLEGGWLWVEPAAVHGSIPAGHVPEDATRERRRPDERSGDERIPAAGIPSVPATGIPSVLAEGVPDENARDERARSAPTTTNAPKRRRRAVDPP